MNKRLSLLPLALIPVLIVLGAVIGNGKYLLYAGYGVAVLTLGSFFLTFEKKETDTLRLVILAVTVALSSAGRVLFAALPAFKPVSALTILAGMWFGGEAGFLVGALSALLSGFYFGLGAWLPFQMLSWGLIGLFAGLLRKPLKKSLPLLCVYGAAAGILYSLMMDVFMAVWKDGGLTSENLLIYLTASLPTTAVYLVSNVVFLLLLRKPVGNAFERVITKYGMEETA